MKYELLGYPENFEKNPVSDIIVREVKYGPVLDAGCGNGNLLVLLKERFDVEGFDISEVAVNLAKKRGLNIKLAGIEDFKADKKYKTILMIGLLVLSKNPGRYLNIAQKWLDKGGVIMLTTPNSSSPKNWLKKKDKYHLYFPGYFAFKRFLKKNNFDVIKCMGAGKLRRFPLLSSVDFYIIKPKDS